MKEISLKQNLFRKSLVMSISDMKNNPTIPKHLLSKSTFMAGVQCEKKLYLHKKHPELRDELPVATQAIYIQGTKVGELAQRLFPGGVDCTPESYYEYQKAVLKTQEKIASGATVIYEAAFQYDRILAAIDILVKEEEGWRAYEVKSSTEVKEVHVEDASLQYYVIQNAGIDLRNMSIVHINNQYVRQGKLKVNELFTIESVLPDVLEKQASIPSQVTRLKELLKTSSVPSIDIGYHCSTPYPCDFIGHCWKHIPSYSVFDIANLRANKKFELYEMGAVKLDEIPPNYKLGKKQAMQIECELKQTSQIDKKKIRQFIKGLEYPLCFLDFETFNPAIPLFDGTRPYEQIAFQYSLHTIKEPGGTIEHHEFLAEPDGNDPRPAFIDQLLSDCAPIGDILVYNIGFERRILEELINVFPEYATQLSAIVDRLVDLMIPFQQRWYYTPEMRGSYSIKAVLPALVPELTYEHLTINDGGAASSTFAAMMCGVFEGNAIATRKNLLAYCCLDTLAMVKIHEKLSYL